MCCPCSDDMEKQEVRMLAQKCDPEGERTVGVLTKADRIEDGTEKQWKSVLNGDRFRLQHGYFAVRNPPQTELDKHIGRDMARKEEHAFFNREGQAKPYKMLRASVAPFLRQDLIWKGNMFCSIIVQTT